MAYRTTPVLGPGLEDAATRFYWDKPRVNANGGTSYEVGTRVSGTDGHVYVLVKNATGGTLSADDRIDIDKATLAVTASGSGTWVVPTGITAGVPNGAFFHARSYDVK